MMNWKPKNTHRSNLFNYSSTRVIQAQYEMAERCIQILRIPEGKQSLILDIG
jgi:hypothetical protein